MHLDQQIAEYKYEAAIFMDHRAQQDTWGHVGGSKTMHETLAFYIEFESK